MQSVPELELRESVAAVFRAADSAPDEAELIADHLVAANLAGHDSHGVIRVAKYVEWCARGDVLANRHTMILRETDSLLMIDGQFGYGQVIGHEAMALAIAKARRAGLCATSIRNSAHLGRIGAWAEMAAEAGLVSVHFVNTSGFGLLVAPFGGSDRRLSANPIAAGAPGPNGFPLVLDISTSAIAEGKIQVARNKGTTLPAGSTLDGRGRPCRDPRAFYGPPAGALLPFGGHKGYGLSFFCEILAGSLTGGGSTHPHNSTAPRLVNNMLSILFDPAAFAGDAALRADIERLVGWVEASPPREKGRKVLVPGEIEHRTRMERRQTGIPLDAATLRQLRAAAEAVGLKGDIFSWRGGGRRKAR